MKTRIQTLRNSLGLSQAEFGEKLGISGPAVSKIESGVNQPSERTIKLICNTFNVREQWLTNGEEPIYKTEYAIQRINEMFKDRTEYFRANMRGLWSMDDATWEIFKKAVDMLDEMKKGKTPS